jgi:methionyl aminopeptidase
MVRKPDELDKMRKAGRVVAEMHECIREAVRPGVTTAELDRVGRQVLDRRHARSNFLNYSGPAGAPRFPAVICASPNDVIVHGIPSDDVHLEEGDVISIDCGAIIQGYHGDAAFTVGVGEISPQAQRMIDVAEDSLAAGIVQMVEGNRLSDIGHAVEQVVDAGGYGTVREYTGHAIGTAMHESPQVPNYGPPGKGPKLKVGNVFAIEPMVNMGTETTRVLADRWAVVTADGQISVHVEHTIAITEDGPEVFTRSNFR